MKERGEERRVVVVEGMKTSEEVTGLQLFSRYELSVTAFNRKGEGPHSLPHHFSTPEGGEMACEIPTYIYSLNPVVRYLFFLYLNSLNFHTTIFI